MFLPMKNCCYLFVVSFLFLTSCNASRQTAKTSPGLKVSPEKQDQAYLRSKVILKKEAPAVPINTHNVQPDELIRFAKRQLGVPYVYGSMDKKKGFDCSGFISYVFGHFNINVPRTTYMFTNAGVDIPIEFSKPGDIILFTGTNIGSGVVGHMGIITKNSGGTIEFIHASSSRGVVISSMNSYFIPRYVKVNRIFIPILASR